MFKGIYCVLLCVCSVILFGSNNLLVEFRDMGEEGLETISTEFSTLIEEYDPTTGTETLGKCGITKRTQPFSE